jgi:cbb3-type cytochrome oxidase subunit 3
MTNSAYAELYFIAAMFILIFIICGVSVYYFFKTYKKERAEKNARLEKKKESRNPKSEIRS